MAALTISPPHVLNSSTHERFNFPDGLAVLPSDYSSVLNKVDSLSPKAQTQSGPDPSVNAPQMHQDGGGSSGSSAVDGRVEEPIQQDINTYGIAGRIWEAAFDLQAYFHSPPHLEFDPPCPLSSRLRSYPAGSTQRVLVELGSGTGVAGLSAASVLASSSSPSISEDVRSSYSANKQTSLSAAHAESADRCRDVIFLTDLPEVVPLLETNVLRWKNELGRAANVESSASASSPSQPTAEDSRVDVRVRALPWGDRHAAERVFEEARRSQSRDGVEREGGITHVLCSDLVYFPGLLAPLLRTLLHLTEKDACRCPPLHDNPGSDPEQLNGPENVGVTVIISCRIRDLEKEWPFWAAFGGWFDFAPVLVRDRRAKAQGRSGGGQWKRFGVAGESWIFIARRKANLADAAGVHFDRRSATDSGSNDGGRVRDRRPSRSGGDMHGRDGDSEEAEGRWMIRHAVDIDALSDSELLGLRQSDAFEELLQMSLVGSGDNDDDTDDEVSGEYVSP